MSTAYLPLRHGEAERELTAAMALGEAVRIAEALLFASREPLAEGVLASAMPAGVSIRDVIAHLEPHYAARGVNLVKVGGRWAFRTAPDLGHLMSKEVEEPRKLSRAAIETLAIIAYHQPVTRAEIEEIRGVATAKGTLDLLMETNWVRMRGRRKTPGRPITFGTTEAFLSHFGLGAVGDLPGLDELKSAGMFDGSLPRGLSIAFPSDDPSLRADEDPLEADPIEQDSEARRDEGEPPLADDGASGPEESEADEPEPPIDPLDGEHPR